VDAHTPGGEEDSNRSSGLRGVSALCMVLTVPTTYLEHLDESYTKVQVCLVAADQAQAKEDADWDDCPQIYATRHGHLFPRVEDGRRAREDLGHDGRKHQMPCCQKDS
jgi:hypothetical protein